MDTKATLAAINDFQNAADKCRPFYDMIEKANILWTNLKDVDAGVLQSLVKERDGLTSQIANLKMEAQTADMNLKAVTKTFQTEQNKLASAHAERKTELEKELAVLVTKIKTEREAWAEELKQLKIAGQNDITTLEQRKTSLEQQIANLKAQASAALHA